MVKYSNEDIVPLKGADRVRKRPAVIFGSSGTEGCLAAVINLIDNSTNEAKAGYGKNIIIKHFEDNSFEIIDKGRGIPVEYNSQEGMYNWQMNFCELYSGNRFKEQKNGYKFSLGLDGLGLCSVQYVSKYMDATIYRKNKKYVLHFEKGENVGGLNIEENIENEKGTCIRFKLDDTVFDDTNIDFEHLEKIVKDYAVSNLGIKYDIEYRDTNKCIQKTYLYRNLAERIKDCFRENEVKTFAKTIEFNEKQNEKECSGCINVCIAYTNTGNVIEVYHHERFLAHGGIGLWELKKILEEKIEVLFTASNVEATQENIENIMNRISIIIHTKLYPKGFVRWENGARKAITNPIIGENIRLQCDSMVEELLMVNKEEIINVINETVK